MRQTRRKPETNKIQAKRYFRVENRKFTPKVVEELKMAFCRAYAQHGIVLDGTTAAGIDRRTYKKWRKEDADFDEACREAEEMANDLMEKEARRRAIDGFQRPVIYRGEITTHYTDYSDALLQTLMRGNKPDKYKERREMSGSVANPLTVDTKETKEQVVLSILSLVHPKPDPEGAAP